jgi:hypothetical protein
MMMMSSIRSLVLGTGLATAAALVATPANAAIVLCYEVGSDTPACPTTDSNVNVDTVTGNTVTGWLNDDHAQLLTFTSAAEQLVGDGSGQATVSAVDELLDTAVTFALTGKTFNAITFNLVPLPGNSDDEAASVWVSYIPADGGSPILYELTGNGNNFYGLYGTEGEQITSVTWGPYSPEGSGIESIKQVRVGGVPGVIGQVPEPATWAMLLFGFGAVGATLRSRKSSAGRRLRIA